MICAAIFAVWLICAVLDYGYTFAYLQGEFPTLAVKDYRRDRTTALAGAVAGPISLFSTFCLGLHKYGLKYR